MKTTWLSDNIKPVLALIVVLLGFSYFYMCSIRNLKPDPQILIAFVSTISLATGYYFGSSSSSSKKDDLLAEKPTVTNTGDSPVTNVAPTDGKS